MAEKLVTIQEFDGQSYNEIYPKTVGNQIIRDVPRAIEADKIVKKLLKTQTAQFNNTFLTQDYYSRVTLLNLPCDNEETFLQMANCADILVLTFKFSQDFRYNGTHSNCRFAISNINTKNLTLFFSGPTCYSTDNIITSLQRKEFKLFFTKNHIRYAGTNENSTIYYNVIWEGSYTLNTQCASLQYARNTGIAPIFAFSDYSTSSGIYVTRDITTSLYYITL